MHLQHPLQLKYLCSTNIRTKEGVGGAPKGHQFAPLSNRILNMTINRPILGNCRTCPLCYWWMNFLWTICFVYELLLLIGLVYCVNGERSSESSPSFISFYCLWGLSIILLVDGALMHLILNLLTSVAQFTDLFLPFGRFSILLS